MAEAERAPPASDGDRAYKNDEDKPIAIQELENALKWDKKNWIYEYDKEWDEKAQEYVRGKKRWFHVHLNDLIGKGFT